MPPSEPRYPVPAWLSRAMSESMGSSRLALRDRVEMGVCRSIRTARWAGVVSRDWTARHCDALHGEIRWRP